MNATSGPARMDLDALLLEAETGVLDEAYAALHSRRVTHYELAGETFTRQRLADLFRLVVASIQTHDLAAMSAFAEGVATERFDHGFDISEVQMAFNSLEEAMWKRVVSAKAPGDLAEAIGMLSTVLGYGKDVVARTYLSLACKRHVPSLDLTSLFAGVTS